jgi:hypothetical protein
MILRGSLVPLWLDDRSKRKEENVVNVDEAKSCFSRTPRFARAQPSSRLTCMIVPLY